MINNDGARKVVERVEMKQHFTAIFNLVKGTSKRLLIAFAILLVTGIGFGIFYGWVVNPVSYAGANFYDLNGNAKGVLILSLADMVDASDSDSTQVIAYIKTEYPFFENDLCNYASTYASIPDVPQARRIENLYFLLTGMGCE